MLRRGRRFIPQPSSVLGPAYNGFSLRRPSIGAASLAAPRQSAAGSRPGDGPGHESNQAELAGMCETDAENGHEASFPSKLTRPGLPGRARNQKLCHRYEMRRLGCRRSISNTTIVASTSEGEAVRELDADSRAPGSKNGKDNKEEATEVDKNGDACGGEILGAEGLARALLGTEGVEDLEAVLKDLEAQTHADDIGIGEVCLKLAQMCDSTNEDPQKILGYSGRAIRIFGIGKDFLQMVACLQVTGSAYYKLREFDKAKVILQQAVSVLEKLKDEMGEPETNPLSDMVQFLLGHANLALGMNEAALENFFKSLCIKEKQLYPGDPDLGMSYQQVAGVCLDLGHVEEAQSLCCKALKILQNFYGQNSTEAATTRKLLALIYTALGQHEKALQEYKTLRPILKAQGLRGEVASLDLSVSERLIELEKYKEAIPVLESVIKAATEPSLLYSSAVVSLAKAHAKLNKEKLALQCCKKALTSLMNDGSLAAADCLLELASVYDELNEVDEAIITYKKALVILEGDFDNKQVTADVQSKLGMLLLFKGRVEEAVSMLKKAVAIFKEGIGSDNEQVMPRPAGMKLIFLYNHIGTANIELEMIDEAVEAFENAKRLSCQLLGPDNPHTIAIHENLVRTYPTLGRYDFAIECQNHIVQSVRKLGEEYNAPLEEAEKKLAQLIEESKTFKKQ